MSLFDEGHATVLVATELAARGLDLRKVRCVVNYAMRRQAGLALLPPSGTHSRCARVSRAWHAIVRSGTTPAGSSCGWGRAAGGEGVSCHPPYPNHSASLAAPSKARDYVHRIGRTGRAGDEGESHSFVLPPGWRCAWWLQWLLLVWTHSLAGRCARTKPKRVILQKGDACAHCNHADTQRTSKHTSFSGSPLVSIWRWDSWDSSPWMNVW